MAKNKTFYHDNAAADIQFDSELGAWLVSVSLAVVDAEGTALPAEVLEVALEEIEALVKSLR